MNLKIKLLLLGLLGVIVSCSEPTEEQSSDTAANYSISYEETSNADGLESGSMLAEVAIAGMKCEMSCVNRVKSTLAKMEGVIDAAIDFDPERDVDQASINFDPKVVSEHELLAAIEGLEYTVQSAVVKTVVATAEPSSEENEAEEVEEGESLDDAEPVSDLISLPNIFGVFTRF